MNHHDLTDTPCPECSTGTLIERSLYDDWDGKLTCSNDTCRHRTDRHVALACPHGDYETLLDAVTTLVSTRDELRATVANLERQQQQLRDYLQRENFDDSTAQELCDYLLSVWLRE